MEWWIWAVAGIVLLGIEVVTPGGLVALFFAAGALAVAPLAAFGLGAIGQWLLFSAVSLASLALLRGPLLARLEGRRQPPVDSLVGQEVVLLSDVPPGGEGRAELRGVPWTARSAGGGGLRGGERVLVERVEGVTLWVRAR
jgi:membrane protein implicated in regulation of membrane protease activity